MTGENGEYNNSKAAHFYPPFSDILSLAKNYKIAPALTVVALAGGGAVYFLKFKKKKPDTKGSADLDDYDYGDEDELEDDIEDEDA